MRAFAVLLLLILAGCSTIPSAELVSDADNSSAGFQELAIVSASSTDRPHPHAVWIQGSYRYDAGHYIWVPGHWDDPASTLAR